eukprot:scaffold75457_cov75-Phaeocystis_antarctica.AAC.2
MQSQFATAAHQLGWPQRIRCAQLGDGGGLGRELETFEVRHCGVQTRRAPEVVVGVAAIRVEHSQHPAGQREEETHVPRPGGARPDGRSVRHSSGRSSGWSHVRCGALAHICAIESTVGREMEIRVCARSLSVGARHSCSPLASSTTSAPRTRSARAPLRRHTRYENGTSPVPTPLSTKHCALGSTRSATVTVAAPTSVGAGAAAPGSGPASGGGSGTLNCSRATSCPASPHALGSARANTTLRRTSRGGVA